MEYVPVRGKPSASAGPYFKYHACIEGVGPEHGRASSPDGVGILCGARGVQRTVRVCFHESAILLDFDGFIICVSCREPVAVSFVYDVALPDRPDVEFGMPFVPLPYPVIFAYGDSVRELVRGNRTAGRDASCRHGGAQEQATQDGRGTFSFCHDTFPPKNTISFLPAFNMGLCAVPPVRFPMCG